MLEQPDGVRQVPLGEVQMAEAGVRNDRHDPSAFQSGEVERRLSVARTLGEGPEHAQGPRQPRPGPDAQGGTGRTRHPVGCTDALPQQRGRPAEVADGIIGLPQVMGGFRLQGALAERG
jgi:hypothetical protein